MAALKCTARVDSRSSMAFLKLPQESSNHELLDRCHLGCRVAQRLASLAHGNESGPFVEVDERPTMECSHGVHVWTESTVAPRVTDLRLHGWPARSVVAKESIRIALAREIGVVQVVDATATDLALLLQQQHLLVVREFQDLGGG